MLSNIEKRLTRVESRLVKLAYGLGIDVDGNLTLQLRRGETGVELHISDTCVTLAKLRYYLREHRQELGNFDVVGVFYKGEHIADLSIE